MKRLMITITMAAAATAAGIVAAPQAAAYPVGPYGIEGPCAGVAAPNCAMSPSPDGLTWAWHGNAWNYDKYGNFVCMSSELYCQPLMAAVRALPPTPIGTWLHPAG